MDRCTDLQLSAKQALVSNFNQYLTFESVWNECSFWKRKENSQGWETLGLGHIADRDIDGPLHTGRKLSFCYLCGLTKGFCEPAGVV